MSEHSKEVREEVIDDIHMYEDEFAAFKIFKPIKIAWRKFVKALQPVFEFHDKYIIYVLNVVLLVGTALVVGYVYMRR
jgi:hypothetical protein